MEKSLKQLLTSSWNIFASSSPMVRLSESSLSTLLVSSLSDSITVNSKCSWSFSASPSASASASALLSASPSPDVLLTSLFSVSGFSFSVSSSFSSVSSSAFFDASSSSSPPFACYTTTKSIIKMCLLHFSQIQFKTCFFFSSKMYLCVICIWWSWFVACTFNWSFTFVIALKNNLVRIFTIVGKCLNVC